jgi:hypothetical protein
MDDCSNEYCVFSGRLLSVVSIASLHEIYSPCVCVSMCVSVSAQALLSLYHT